MTASLPAAGLRERNKADKLQRIRQAASELFVEKGYDDTTIREIAQRADVGFGTLFTYASDKRDLLFLIFNDELAATVEQATRDARKKEELPDQLVAFFRGFYRFFGARPALSRIVLREMTFYLSGKQAGIFQRSRRLLLERVTQLVAQAQADGRIRKDEDAELLGRALFSIYTAELRDWIGGDAPVDLRRGLVQLQRMLCLVIDGFSPRAER
jgi:AcrR family transcriptional regulator